MKYAALYAILFLVLVGLAALVLIHYQHARNLRRQNRGPQDRHAAAKPIALAAAEVQIDVERGTTPRVEAQKIPENVGQTRGPNVWEHDGDAQQAYGLPACPQCPTGLRLTCLSAVPNCARGVHPGNAGLLDDALHVLGDRGPRRGARGGSDADDAYRRRDAARPFFSRGTRGGVDSPRLAIPISLDIAPQARTNCNTQYFLYHIPSAGGMRPASATPTGINPDATDAPRGRRPRRSTYRNAPSRRRTSL